jgi:undecaprenyl-phosphate 4-deoxy-4-formamido-L-arabinose transferase
LLIGKLTGWFVVHQWELAFWIVSMLGGLQLLFVGILGEYVGRLSMTQSGMPAYVVKQTWGVVEEKTA